jgi:quinolinate synthase
METATKTNAKELAGKWYEKFSRHAEDLYPGRYTRPRCMELAEMGLEILELARRKGSTIVAHNYLFPEFHEIAHKVGDSLGLSLHVRDIGAERVDFESVFFMGATAKIITGDATRVFVADYPDELGCTLVFGTDYKWLEKWKRLNPDGILITYINSDAYTKSISDFISTSRNTDKIIVYAAKKFPGRKILVLPDKYLGYVMKAKAVQEGVDPGLVEVYSFRKGEFNASCYVHEKIGESAVDEALDEHPDAELMIHPECGCASSCLFKLNAGLIPHAKAYFLSTEQMVERARVSTAGEFIVATEMGMVYRLRKEIPEKTFFPVSLNAVCDYMKANTFEKLQESLKRDRLEVLLCEDCCDPKEPYQDDRAIHIQRSVADKAQVAIGRMFEVT